MAIYIINFSLIGLFGVSSLLVASRKPNANYVKNIFLFLAAIQLILVLALRGTSVGIDTYAYYTRFLRYSQMTIAGMLLERQELGFSLIMRLVYMLGGGYQWFLFI